MKGWLLALASVLLVSLAQLLLRTAMLALPPLDTWTALPWQHGLIPLIGGLAAYGCSMLCWLLALRRLPLNRLYPLLSLSYVLVWLAAISLPALHETFRWSSLAGVILIVCGLLCVALPRR
ncbi:hypothetical protein N172_10700 [Pantoea dispersa EGD-AAK13]|uniref:4-amino-4-deoxy-L-arabinose-phosphoundecaprenol flippase subunit ArnF n=1 Tax=Pantoea TaxID=53335 RepID=UPI00039638ED|nr:MULTISPECIES: 4-amino-4-deoxy-L-arabinose-phosphoundecaprenol flippase subunit ArnF [Pantoea]ERH62119.1 hypothetical protein N172_10700 [Pantoea dispersa EGD-AAK13]OWS74073.1 4-amino-4-deoxy-L-arabinose-phospho-UDP flippase [Pantoea sp. VS1]